MNRSFTRWAAGAAAALALQVFGAGSASAHHLDIVASSSCVQGQSVINYTATSWSAEAVIGENPLVTISVNGFVLANGAFQFATGNKFSGTLPAPLGDQAVVTATAAGVWGDLTSGGQTASITVSLANTCGGVLGDGRFTGGGSQVRVGAAKITKGLTIHCDLLLSNNLEINWGSNKFHMTEHLSTVKCSDDPAIVQAPPPAPLDTLVGVGTGSYNNDDGYTVEFTLVDYGEPGSADRAALKIYETANPANVVLDLPLQVLAGGNLQAHYDQPHK
jgi:hypothetical protein